MSDSDQEFEILKEQLHHICTQARRSVAARYAVLLVGGHNSDSPSEVSCGMSSSVQAGGQAAVMSELTLALLRTADNLLAQNTAGELRVFLRSHKTGEEVPIGRTEVRRFTAELG